jgi:hypothetical protein
MTGRGQKSTNDNVRVVGQESSFDTGQCDEQGLIIKETCLHDEATDIIVTVSVLLFQSL